MKVENASISSLVSDPANARKHSEKNLKAIKGSLAKFGQQKPIVVGKGNVVIAGNGTLEAAKALGWEKIKIVRTDLTGTEATAFAIADNRAGELAGWDFEILGAALASLKAEDFDIGEIGFDLNDFNLLTPSQEPDYSVIEEGEGDSKRIDDMRGEVRKAIQIEFDNESYEKAFELVKFWRQKGVSVGMMLIEKLKSEKEALEGAQ